MKKYLADTHALFWYLTGSDRLGPNAQRAFDEGERGQATVYVPAIVLAELCYLNRKFGRPLDFAAEFRRLSGAEQIELVPLMPRDVLKLDEMPEHLEMHDCMIACAAHRIGAAVLTKDHAIGSIPGFATVW